MRMEDSASLHGQTMGVGREQRAQAIGASWGREGRGLGVEVEEKEEILPKRFKKGV